jgi:hypothetical protein
MALALLVTLLAAGHALGDPLPAPLSPAQANLFNAAPEDSPTEELAGVSSEVAGRHYLTSDEGNLHLFYPSIKGIGGAYAGVGSDPAYVLIGWARPQLAWLIDYDLWVSYTHLIHLAFIREADTPEGYLSLWSDNIEQSVATLERVYAAHPQRQFIQQLYRQIHLQVHARLTSMRDSLRAHGAPSYLDDLDTYTYVRALVLGGRVRPMVANLLEPKAMTGIASATRALGLPLRALYLSNAEQYWTYSDTFRANASAQPFDDRSLILRTLSTQSINKDYRYNTQPALSFLSWLRLPSTHQVYDIIPRPPLRTDEVPFSHFDDPPPAPTP